MGAWPSQSSVSYFSARTSSKRVACAQEAERAPFMTKRMPDSPGRIPASPASRG